MLIPVSTHVFDSLWWNRFNSLTGVAVQDNGDILLDFIFTRPTLTNQANGNQYIVRVGLANYCTELTCVETEFLGKTSTKYEDASEFDWQDTFILSWDGVNTDLLF